MRSPLAMFLTIASFAFGYLYSSSGDDAKCSLQTQASQYNTFAHIHSTDHSVLYTTYPRCGASGAGA